MLSHYPAKFSGIVAVEIQRVKWLNSKIQLNRLNSSLMFISKTHFFVFCI